MRALLFDYPPPPRDAPKDVTPQTARVLGANVYAFDVARALATHGTYDAYYHLDRDPLAERAIRPAGNGNERHWVASLGALDDIARVDDLVLMTPRTSPQGLVSLRALLGRPPRPITACIHTLSGITAPYLTLGLLFANLGAHDAVLCSTRVGKRVVERLLDLALDALDAGDGPPPRPPVRLPVIPLGTDCSRPAIDRGLARRRLGIPNAATVLLYVGRFSASTKCDLGPLLLTFARHLRDDDRQVRLVIAGDDQQHHAAGAIREWSRTLGCQQSVCVLPDITDPQRRDLLAASDVFVSFSDNVQETFGLTIVEAMAAGLPVVASDWDGYRELVEHGTTGFLAPTSWPALTDRFDLSAPPSIAENLNAVLAASTAVDCEAAAEYLQILIRDPERRAAMGVEAARQARRRFDWPVVVRQYEELWAELSCAAQTISPRTRLEAPGPLAYRCQEVFADYPTDVVDDTATLTITETGEWWLARGIRLEPLPGVPAGFRDEAMRGLAQSLLANGPMTMAALIDRAAPLGLPDLALRLHVGRLLKYGIVRRAQPQD